MASEFVIPAFIAGILTFLAPCTLPLVPGYLAYVSGVSAGDLKDGRKLKFARRRIFINGALYVLGFSFVFIAFGALAGFAGQALTPYRPWLARIGGILVIIFGLFMLGFLRLRFLSREFRLGATNFFLEHRPRNSFLLGAAFAFGWTPCVGPILGSILLLASVSQTALSGALLLSVFSLGLAVPFLAIALIIGSALRYVAKFSKYLGAISTIGGIFLIFLGILLFLDKTAILIPYGYRLFRFINYERLLDYL